MRLFDQIHHCVPLLVLGPVLVLGACKQDDRAPAALPSSPDAVVEVLAHDEGAFTVVHTARVGPRNGSVTLEGVAFGVEERWLHAAKQQLVTNDRPEPHHGVEIAWDGPGEPSRWIYQSEDEDMAAGIADLGAMVRLTAPGSRSIDPAEPDPLRAVQFLRQGRRHDLPGIGGMLDDPWSVTGIMTYEHALIDDSGNVHESDDGGFVNRAVEVLLSDGRGTTERHLAFLDHPRLTRGIHPTLLPVTRLEGDQASQSRLVVCEPMPASDDHHRVHFTPHRDGGGLTAHVRTKGPGTLTVTEISEFPVELPLPGNGSLRVLRHFAHARPHVKWERAEVPSDGTPRPALVVSRRAGHHGVERFVLREDEITPCRLDGDYLWLRYRTGPDHGSANLTTDHHEDTDH